MGTGGCQCRAPDDEQLRASQRGRKEVVADVPIRLYAQVDVAVRRRDVSIAGAVRRALDLWAHPHRR